MKETWPTKSLGDVCQLISGQHIDSKDYNLHMRGIGYLTGPSDFGPIHPVVSKWTEHPKITAKSGDLLITVKGTGVGKVNLLDDAEVAISRQLMAVRVTGAEPRFIYAILSSAFDHFQSLSTGAAIPGISREQVLGLTFTLPPLPEQQRIVALLDEAFAGLATAKANAERNLQNARAIFESHLQSVFTPRDGEGWATMKLGDVCDFKGGSQPPKSQFVYEQRPGYVRFLQIRDYASEKQVTYIPETAKNRLCNSDDIMIGRYGASVGKILTGQAGAYNVALIKTIPDLRLLDRTFFFHYLHSRAFQHRLADVASRSAQDGFGKDDIYGFPVPVPSLNDQQKVIQQMEPLSEETQRLTRLYERKLAALEELKKSLLYQAFNGEL
jgi:type I restriction enzyme S subunit